MQRVCWESDENSVDRVLLKTECPCGVQGTCKTQFTESEYIHTTSWFIWWSQKCSIRIAVDSKIFQGSGWTFRRFPLCFSCWSICSSICGFKRAEAGQMEPLWRNVHLMPRMSMIMYTQLRCARAFPDKIWGPFMPMQIARCGRILGPLRTDLRTQKKICDFGLVKWFELYWWNLLMGFVVAASECTDMKKWLFPDLSRIINHNLPW